MATRIPSSSLPASIAIAAGGLPKVAFGSGCIVTDTTGKSYLDGSGGPAVFCLGHGNAEVNAAIADQLDRIAHGYRYTFTSDPLEELVALLQRRLASEGAPGLRHIVFVTGGSEAVESCLKLALQYHSARGDSGRRRFISRQRSWHGNTLGALGVSEFAERTAPFEGAFIPSIKLGAVNAYRPRPPLPADASPEAVGAAGAAELDAAISAAGAETIAAFIFEPVVGAAGGVVPAPPGYAQAVREVCDRYGVLMIADEVMCGAGRCGTWRALAHDGVEPDIMAVAKGLAGGYLPLGAAIFHDRVAEPLRARYGGPMTGHTFSGHTACLAAGLAVQRIVERDDLIAKVARDGVHLQKGLQERLGAHPHVGDIRGRGFFVGLELVADRETKTPFPADRQLYLAVRQAAFTRGLICYPSGGNVDGYAGDTVILAPPYIATRSELDAIIDRLAAALDTAIAA